MADMLDTISKVTVAAKFNVNVSCMFTQLTEALHMNGAVS